MRIEHTPIVRLSAQVALLLAATALLGACEEDNEGNPTGGVCDAETTLTISLPALEQTQGFAPFQVEVAGRVSLLDSVSYTWTIDYGDGGTSAGTDSQPTAGHLYTAAGKYTIRLTVTDTTCGRTQELTQEVEVLAPVELTGDDLQGSPSNLVVGDQVDVGMRVVNLSRNALTLPLTIQYFLSPQPSLLWSQLELQIPLGSVTLMPEDGVTLNPGAQRAFTEALAVPETVPTGSYYLAAAIDYSDQIGEEEDEQNNNLVLSRAPVQVVNEITDNPDLVVEPTALAVGPGMAFRELTTVRANGQVSNIGSRPVGFGNTEPTTYALFLHDAQAFDLNTATRIFESAPFELDNQGNNTVRIDRLEIALEAPIRIGPQDPDREVWVTLCADPDGEIAEGNPNDANNRAEQNNCATQSTPLVVTNVVSEGTDIVLEDFNITPTATFLDGTIEVTLEVANFGTVETGSFFCSVYLSEDEALSVNEDTRLTNVNFRSLAADAEDSVQLSRVVTIPGFFAVGEYAVFAACDPSGVVQETFEDNNVIKLDGRLRIAAEAIIDLYVTSFEVEPTTLENGGSLTANLTIFNEGSSGSGPTEVVLRRSLDANVNADDPIIARGMLPPVGPGESVEVPLVVSGLECGIFEGAYTLAAQVDPLSAVPEVNTRNNLTLLEMPLVITGERCLCEEDDYEPNETPTTAVPVSTGVYEDQTICVGGRADYYKVNLTRGQSVTVRVNLQYGGACSNLDLRLLDTNFQVIPDAISDTNGALEQADLFLIQQEGEYTIEIKGRSGCDVNRYDMEVMILDPIPGVDLTGSDLRVSETNPALLEEVTLTYSLLNIGSDDAGAHDLTFYLTQDLMIGLEDFTLESARRDIHEGALIQRGQTLAVTIPRNAINGAYFICAVLDSGEGVEETNEENNVFCSEQITVDTDCFDPFELNDTAERATQLEPGVYENLTVCNQGRKDFYRFCAGSDTRMEVSLDFVHDDGDIDLRLYEEDSQGMQTQIGVSSGDEDREVLGVNYVAGDRCYVAEVLLQSDGAETASNTYRLNVLVEPGDPALACDNHFEPNDNPTTAQESAANLLHVINGVDDEGNPVPQVLDRCPENDIDYYYLDLRAGPTITLCAVNDRATNPQDYVLNLILTGPNNNPPQLQVANNTMPCVTHRVTVDGRYYIRVRATNPDRRAIRYGFTLEGLFGTDLTARNLTLEPTDILPGETFLIYNFTIQNALTDAVETLNYGIYYSTDPVIDPTEDLLLETQTVDGINGLSDRTAQGVFLVPQDPAFQRGQGYIGVFLDPDDAVEEENEGNNFLQRQANFIVCSEDMFFGNQTRASGATIELGTTYEALSVCPNTTDWYCLDELPAGDYTAAAAFALASPNDLDTDLNLEVLQVNAERDLVGLLGRDLRIANDASVAFTLAEPAPVCLRVFPVRATGANTYSLTVTGPPPVEE
jgi:PKD repeat protein